MGRFHVFGISKKEGNGRKLEIHAPARGPELDAPLETLKDKRLPYTECASCGQRLECLDGGPVGGCPCGPKKAA